MRIYHALVHKDDGSAYGITFPDLDGCFAAADREADLHEAAQEALILYAKGEAALPAPRSMTALLEDASIQAELASGAALLVVPLILIGRKARYNIMLDVDVAAGADRKARTLGINRSEFISSAVQEKLRRIDGHVILPDPSKATATGKRGSAERSAAASALAQKVSKAAPAKKAAARKK